MNERDIFIQALQQPYEKRSVFLDETCGTDNRLRERIDALLLQERGLDSFLEQPAYELRDVDEPLSGGKVPIGSTIGPYRLMEQIGEGGFGLVFVAEQCEPVRRKVALKLIKPGMDSKEIIARFEAERQALAYMEHPNIAHVLDAGTTETGRPYFVMELVRGIPITEFCDENNLSGQQRLELFIPVCQAIQHAHQKAIIHRDIKPSNVLVTMHDDKAVPKVIDFGLAKATQAELTTKTLYTQFRQFIGTPAYMSPEQAHMSGLDIDTRCDVYALGVLLYELLTGATPFNAKELREAGYEEICRRLREDEPPKPSSRVTTMDAPSRSSAAKCRSIDPDKLGGMLRGDLDWIIMKAMEKDRTRRYETANGLARDVERYLASEPVTAVAPSAVYLLSKYWRRHKRAITTALAMGGLLIAGTVASTWLAVLAFNAENRATISQKTAQQERDNAYRISYASDMNLIERELSRGNLGRARFLLDRHRPAKGQVDLRGWEWRYLWQQCQSDPHTVLFDRPASINGRETSLSVSHDGNYVAVVAADERVSVWNVRTQREIDSWPGYQARFSPVELLLAFWSEGDPRDSRGPRIGIHLWDPTKKEIVEVIPLEVMPRGIQYSADGRSIAAMTLSRRTKSLNADDGIVTEKIFRWTIDGQKMTSADANMENHFGSGFGCALASDLSFAAHGTQDPNSKKRGVRVVYFQKEGDVRESFFANSGEFVETVALSPDDKMLAVGYGVSSTEIQIWDVQRRVLLRRLDGHLAYVKDLKFFPDGRTLASVSADQSVRLWDLSDLENVPPPRVLQGHEDEVCRLAVSSDGTRLVSGCRDGAAFVWDLSAHKGREISAFSFAGNGWWDWNFKPDKSALISCDQKGISRWTGAQFEREEVVVEFAGSVWGGCVNHDATQVAVGYVDGSIKLWDVERRVINEAFTTNDGPAAPREFLAEGEKLAVTHGGRAGTLSLWDLTNLKKVYAWPKAYIRFSPDACICLSFSGNKNDVHANRMTVHNLVTGKNESMPDTWRGTFLNTAFSADSRYLAASTIFTDAATGNEVNVWDLSTRKRIGTFGRFLMAAHSVNFSPDGQRLIATSGSFEAIKLWDIHSQQQLLTLPADGSTLYKLRFHANGDVISAHDIGRTDRIVHFWRAPSFEEIQEAESDQ